MLMRSLLAAALAMALTACTSTRYTDLNGTITIRGGIGGTLLTIRHRLAAFSRMAESPSFPTAE